MTRRREEIQDAPAEIVVHTPPARHSESRMLDLQRSAGNAAVARMVARQPAAGAPSIGVDPSGVGPGTVMDAENKGLAAVERWFRPACISRGKDGTFNESAPELVALARALPVTRPDGSTTLVRELIIDPATVDSRLRQIARQELVILRENRGIDDVAGVEAQTTATLSNLGQHLPEISFGSEQGKITVGMNGKVMAGTHVGRTEVEAGGGPEGAEAGIKGRGGEAKVEGGPKGVKAEGKLGSLITIKAEIEKEQEGWKWKAYLGFGTLGQIIKAGDIAKAVGATNGALTRSAVAVAGGAKSVDEHAKPLNDALHEIAEKAKKSAAQNREGAQFGLEGSGDEKGGFAVGVTFIVVF